jgi:hypothetical protein
MIDSSRAAPSRQAVQHLRSVLLRGVDIYQPEDLAAKLTSSTADEDVGNNLAKLLGPRARATATMCKKIARRSSVCSTGRPSSGGLIRTSVLDSPEDDVPQSVPDLPSVLKSVMDGAWKQLIILY